MKSMSDQTSWSKYTFEDHTGYVMAPWLAGATNDWVYIRHSSSVPPWVDDDVHLHTDAEEYFFVFQGELRLLINKAVFTLRPYEALLVRPQAPHSIDGGTGPIEHFVLRVPAYDDRQSLGEIPAEVPLAAAEDERAQRRDWGCRVPLAEARYQNCWLFGVGQARFRSDQICLAYLDLRTEESADANWRTHPHQVHVHRESWEYYTVLAGKKTLRIDDELVEIEAGEILEMPPGVKHVAEAIEAPYQGFTVRAPRRDDKVVLKCLSSRTKASLTRSARVDRMGASSHGRIWRHGWSRARKRAACERAPQSHQGILPPPLDRFLHNSISLHLAKRYARSAFDLEERPSTWVSPLHRLGKRRSALPSNRENINCFCPSGYPWPV